MELLSFASHVVVSAATVVASVGRVVASVGRVVASVGRVVASVATLVGVVAPSSTGAADAPANKTKRTKQYCTFILTLILELHFINE